jgi:hypothetical protein
MFLEQLPVHRDDDKLDPISTIEYTKIKKIQKGEKTMAAKTIAVRYQSRGGNTKAVAEVISQTLGVIAEPIGEPMNDPVDVLFIGGGVYAFDLDKELKAWLATLKPETVKTVAAFSTAGGMDGTNKIAAAAKANGIKVIGQLPVKVHARNLGWLGGKGEITFLDKEIAKIKAFASEMT